MLTKEEFILWNAALISRAANWNHSLLTTPRTMREDANKHGGVTRYLSDMRSYLNAIEEQLALPQSPTPKETRDEP